MKHNPVRLLCMLFLLAFSVYAGNGNSGPDLHRRALQYLKQYSLSVECDPLVYNGKLHRFPLSRIETLPNPESLKGFEKDRMLKFLELSESVGLKPRQYLGKPLTVLSYLTKDSTWAGEKAGVGIFFHDTVIVAAILSVPKIGGGRYAINDRSEFRPKGFVFPRFNASELKYVAIAGPNHQGSGHEKILHLTTDNELEYFSQLLINAVKSDKNITCHSESTNFYLMSVRFKKGELLSFLPIYSLNDSVYVGHISGYLRMNNDFKEFLDRKIEEKGLAFKNELYLP